MKYILAVLVMTFSMQAFSGKFGYECVVESSYRVSGEGELIRNSTMVFEGEKFSVSRETGEVAGFQAVSSMRAKQLSVINQGTSEMSFKSIALFSHPNVGGEINVIEIEEFVESDEKPFVMMRGVTIFSGICI
jgi:hypothetical protein